MRSKVIGIIAGLVYIPVSYTLLHRLSIDDPVDAFAVHGVAGGKLDDELLFCNLLTHV